MQEDLSRVLNDTLKDLSKNLARNPSRSLRIAKVSFKILKGSFQGSILQSSLLRSLAGAQLDRSLGLEIGTFKCFEKNIEGIKDAFEAI